MEQTEAQEILEKAFGGLDSDQIDNFRWWLKDENWRGVACGEAADNWIKDGRP